MLKPVLKYRGVQYIDLKVLRELNVLGILLDVDNTLIDYKHNMTNEVKAWVDEAKNFGFKLMILSNSNNISKVKKVAEMLDLKYIKSAKKPLKGGFNCAAKILDIKPKNLAMVGDQLFTDVLGANLMEMISIYVDPIDKKEAWYTKWKRPIESFILNRIS